MCLKKRNNEGTTKDIRQRNNEGTMRNIEGTMKKQRRDIKGTAKTKVQHRNNEGTRKEQLNINKKEQRGKNKEQQNLVFQTINPISGLVGASLPRVLYTVLIFDNHGHG